MKHAVRPSENPDKKQAQDNDTVDTTAVSIRDVPVDVWHKLKVEAVKRKINMGELLSQIVEELGL